MKKGAGPEDFEYYVHYTEYNRRLDEWVGAEKFDPDTIVRPNDDKEGGSGRTRNQKRKAEEGHEDGHEEFDPQSLREHEEFTKVKNIQSIELGRWEMGDRRWVVE